MPLGRRFETIGIAAGQLSARILSYGASLRDLRLQGHEPPLVLGFEEDEHYIDHSRFHGAICGRFANRIRDGGFTLDGKVFALDRNDGRHTLHGGRSGTWGQVWELAEQEPDFATLLLKDPDGSAGFPGKLSIACTWRVRAPATLEVELVATADRATLCNLAAHPYFNLDDGGASPSGDHRLEIGADAYLPVDEEGIPTGEVRSVAGTAFDFRNPRPIRLAWEEEIFPYDNCYCLSSSRQDLRRVASVHGAHSGVEMEVWTTEPGLQFFDGDLPARPAPGLDGIRYGPRAGFCLEPQGWPDSPNIRYFPQSILRPGERYRQVTQYRFSRNRDRAVDA